MFILLVGSIVTTSCTKENEILIEPELSSSSVENNHFEQFIASVDSLNLYYSTGNPDIEYINTRGFWSLLGKGSAVVLADAAGGYVGGWVGKIVGGSIGSLTGTPIGTVVGYVGGGKAGSYLGGGISSYIASEYLGNRISVSKIGSDLSISNGYNNVEDSIGYIHNQVMKKLINNGNKYILSGGGMDYDKIYNDCVLYYKEYGIYEPEMLTNSQCRNRIIDFAKQTSENTKQLATGDISESQFFMNQEILFKNKCDATDEEIKIYNDFGAKIVKQCGVLSTQEIHEYAAALNSVIKSSELSYKQKETIVLTAQIAVNSSLCWSEKE